MRSEIRHALVPEYKGFIARAEVAECQNVETTLLAWAFVGRIVSGNEGDENSFYWRREREREREKSVC